ncbi:MAG: hypothetical protein MUQ10_19850 [Anaerolineae bacterium]|nr:hypothetical protein [Anaerolineae bacterium]
MGPAETLNRNFGLCNEARELAALTFETRLVSRTTAWSFKRTAFSKPIVTARVAGREARVALCHPRWTGNEGEIELGGHRYAVTTSDFWTTQFEIRDSGGRLLVTYRSGAKKRCLGNLIRIQ